MWGQHHAQESIEPQALARLRGFAAEPQIRTGAELVQLSVREISELFGVPESRIYRWVHEEGLPSLSTDGQHYFNRSEVLEWASLKKIALSPKAVREWSTLAPGSDSLAMALRAGGVARVTAAASRQDALQAVARLIPVAEESDRAPLLELLLAREAQGSTAVNDGIAIPHPRHPMVMTTDHAIFLVAYLDPAVDFGAADGRPVHTLLALVSPTIRSHLAMLARIAVALRDAKFRSLLEKRSSAEELLAEIERIEAPYHDPDRTP
jgi:PTS system nitrogen regulatory IIA component